jgi:predicted nucleic-acid-binding Zn-ribbon protein
MELKLLCCPKCGGTVFEVYLASVELIVVSSSFLLHKCRKCGWESHPRDEGQIRQTIVNMLRGEMPKEGFKIAQKP